MLGPAVAVSLISVGVRGVIAAGYGKLNDRPTWVFNGTALIVSFAVKAFFAWHRRNEQPQEMAEYQVVLYSQSAGHLAGSVALSILKETLTKEDVWSYALIAGLFTDLSVTSVRFV